MLADYGFTSIAVSAGQYGQVASYPSVALLYQGNKFTYTPKKQSQECQWRSQVITAASILETLYEVNSEAERVLFNRHLRASTTKS